MTVIVPIPLPEDVEAKLRERVGADDIVLSEFVRQAITEKLARTDHTSAVEVQSSSSGAGAASSPFGRYSSGREDLAEDYEQILREKLRAEHSR